jgi:hypothetical protein
VKLLEKNAFLPAGAIDLGAKLPWIHDSALIGVLAFATLAYSLYHFARKPL